MKTRTGRVTTSSEIAAMVNQAAECVGPCILCGQPTHDVGVLLPSDSQRFGAAIGKQRVIIYRLCGTCHALPSAFERAESVLLQATSVSMN